MTTTVLPVLPQAETVPAPPAAAPPQSLADHLNRLSEEEFYVFCRRNPDQKFERRADGTIELSAMTGGTTGNRNIKLLARLQLWAEDNGTGLAFDSSTGFRLANGAIRSPDAAWVRAETWQALPAEQQDRFPPLCPDFVVELLSPSDALPELLAKMQEYINNGCRLAWLIDPKTETARIFRADGTVSVAQTFAETLNGEAVLPGFTFALSTLR